MCWAASFFTFLSIHEGLRLDLRQCLISGVARGHHWWRGRSQGPKELIDLLIPKDFIGFDETSRDFVGDMLAKWVTCILFT